MSDETPKPRTQTNPTSLANLRPPKEGEPARNPKGTNGWDARRKVLIDFLEGKSADPDRSRIENVIIAAYTNSLKPKGVQDRKILTDQFFGKAREQHDITSDGKELAGASVAVALVDAVVASALEKLHKPDDEGNGGTAPPVG